MADVRAVIFDLDDTLYRERRFVLSGLRHVARLIACETGADATGVFRTAVRALRHGPRFHVLQAVCREHRLDVARVPAWVDALRGHAPALRLPRLTASTLVALRGEGRRLAILTNGLVDVQRRKLVALHLPALVDACICAEAVVAGGKPHLAAFDAALTALGVAARDAVMVGNADLEDIRGARAAGLRAILVAPRPSALQVADVVVRSIAEVPDAVHRLERRPARVG